MNTAQHFATPCKLTNKKGTDYGVQNKKYTQRNIHLFSKCIFSLFFRFPILLYSTLIYMYLLLNDLPHFLGGSQSIHHTTTTQRLLTLPKNKTKQTHREKTRACKKRSVFCDCMCTANKKLSWEFFFSPSACLLRRLMPQE